MDNLKLVEIARDAQKKAYAPYSKFMVGAAVVTKEDHVYAGCNIENSSFGATNCAERTAIFKGVSEGERNFEKIAIVSSGGEFTFPCGICRQVLYEFMEDGQVILADTNNNIKVFSVKELVPFAFKL